MRDIGEGTSVDEGGIPFQCLHQIWFNGIFHQDRDRACHAQVFSSDSFAALVCGNDHCAEPFAHIFEPGCQCKDRHDFRCNRNIVP